MLPYWACSDTYFEDVQELRFKFQHTEAQEPVGIPKLNSWEVCMEAMDA